MSKLTIIKGDEFKIALSKKIRNNDVFINEYKRAAFMLDEIIGASIEAGKRDTSWSWKQQDFENNIIAFCGERGEGKSSAMMSFVNEIYEDKRKENEIFAPCKNLNKVYFAEPILIDPSLFDDVHNVLDIVLAKIFKKFYSLYNNDNQYTDERTRERLLDHFQKVYRYVSLINNQKQMLDDEFDYEGNISKLSKLGNSTNLKEELAKLIVEYLRFLDKNRENNQLIIAIDDLDLCSANAYKMAEQIRKYLIIPNVIIVISVRIEQLELCIREKSLQDFTAIYKNGEEEIYRQLNREVRTMAERYVSKLIPIQRRIYLPKVQSFDEIYIEYKSKDDNGEKILWDSRTLSEGAVSFTVAMLELICDRTGMYFLPEDSGISYLLPNNLRDMISWIIMIADMENPEGRDTVYYENILKFERYFLRNLSGGNLKLYDELNLYDIGNMDTFHMHIAVRGILENIYIETDKTYNPQYRAVIAERKDSFFEIMNYFELCAKSIVDISKETYIYQLRALYTIKINRYLRNHQFNELVSFISGYIWGPGFWNILPASFEYNLDRSRFAVEVIDGVNCILRRTSGFIQGMEYPEMGKPYSISYITEKEKKREVYITAWIILGLLSNVYYSNNQQVVYSYDNPIIANNNRVLDYVHISLENYLVSLCNLEGLYEKVNMARLGIERLEFERIVSILEEENAESIQCAREIVSNIDLAMQIKDYCMKNREYKGDTKNPVDRSARLVDRFFKNIADYLNGWGIKSSLSAFKFFTIWGEAIDISEIYAELFEQAILNIPLRKQLEEDQQVEAAVLSFRKKITEQPEKWSRAEMHVSKSLRNLSAENMKLNLDNLAVGIQTYLGEMGEEPEALDVERLCSLYSEVARMYFQNKNTFVTREMHDEYRKLVKVQEEIKSTIKFN